MRRVERLTATRVTAAALTACAPIGLDIGAVSPAEVAISVMGEIMLTRRQKPLRAETARGESMNVTAIVLAAGRGARFDATRSKLLADFGGRLLVRYAVEAALGSKASKTIVIIGHARDEIERALAGLPVVFAYNSDFANGMASSLRAGLAHAADSAGALALPADMPGMISAILDQLISAFNCTPDCVAVAPLYQENLQITTLSVAAAFRG